MHIYVRSFLLVYMKLSHQALTSNIKATFIASFVALQTWKSLWNLRCTCHITKSMCVIGGWAPSQLLGQKTNLQSVHSKTPKWCHRTPNPTKETQDYWNMLVRFNQYICAFCVVKERNWWALNKITANKSNVTYKYVTSTTLSNLFFAHQTS